MDSMNKHFQYMDSLGNEGCDNEKEEGGLLRKRKKII